MNRQELNYQIGYLTSKEEFSSLNYHERDRLDVMRKVESVWKAYELNESKLHLVHISDISVSFQVTYGNESVWISGLMVEDYTVMDLVHMLSDAIVKHVRKMRKIEEISLPLNDVEGFKKFAINQYSNLFENVEDNTFNKRLVDCIIKVWGKEDAVSAFTIPNTDHRIRVYYHDQSVWTVEYNHSVGLYEIMEYDNYGNSYYMGNKETLFQARKYIKSI